jgi:phage-related protein
MATFPAITPTYGAQKSSRPNVRTVQFGDGYQQRLTYGLNQNPKSWSLTWEVSETDADTIETFLNNRAADNASFDWTPLDEATSYKWICPEWNKSVPYKNRATITATFQQVFEP